MANEFPTLSALAVSALLAVGMAEAQAIPSAPPVPACDWDAGGARSTCKFKDALAGTPTSVVGNRVIVFRRSAGGGHGDSRTLLDQAVTRLADRYGFTATLSEDPAVFSAANLADAKVIILSNGDGDVVPPGPYRTALEDFQQVKGWGMIWIHAACSFITSGWPFGQKSCVQQYFHHNPSGTPRRIFIDSGTAASPHHGKRNPESEFLLRGLPGWGGNPSLPMWDEWFCFREPARNTAGVNVLFGYDRGSGLAPSGCPAASDPTEAASRNHNLAWTHRMGKGITIFNSWGHDDSTYVAHGNMGDSLLWRYIRYAAKDWCAGGGGDPGCDASVAVREPKSVPGTFSLQGQGALSLSLPGAGQYRVTVAEAGGRIVASQTAQGPGKLAIPGLRRGLYLVRIGGAGPAGIRRFMVL